MDDMFSRIASIYMKQIIGIALSTVANFVTGWWLFSLDYGGWFDLDYDGWFGLIMSFMVADFKT